MLSERTDSRDAATPRSAALSSGSGPGSLGTIWALALVVMGESPEAG